MGEVAKLVEKIPHSEHMDGIVDVPDEHCLRCQLEAALRLDAQPPPVLASQKQCCDCVNLCEKLTNPLPEGRFCMAEAAQEKMRAEQPRAASAGALSALPEKWRNESSHSPIRLAAYGSKDCLEHCADELEAALSVEKPTNVATVIGAMLYRVAITGEHSGNWASNEQVEKATQAILNLHKSLAAHDQKVREPLAAWMVENGFAKELRALVAGD